MNATYKCLRSLSIGSEWLSERRKYHVKSTMVMDQKKILMIIWCYVRGASTKKWDPLSFWMYMRAYQNELVICIKKWWIKKKIMKWKCDIKKRIDRPRREKKCRTIILYDLIPLPMYKLTTFILKKNPIMLFSAHLLCLFFVVWCHEFHVGIQKKKMQ